MNGNPKKILVATDGSRDSVSAARRAVGLAKAFDAELFLVHVVPVSVPYHMSGDDFDEGPSIYEEDAERAQRILDEQVKEINEAGGEVAKAYLKVGEPDAEVVTLAEDIEADLVVAGSRGKSPLRRPIGSVSSSIAAHAHCPVLVVRESGSAEGF
ncbi:MAG TPA: universal stress protein [Rubrobacter sp.]|nr:universal stress protein [Rubrobacter sp.]